MKKFVVGLAVAGLCASMAFADKPQLRTLAQGKYVRPNVAQRLGPGLQAIGPRITFPNSQGGIATGTVLAFDQFEPDGVGGPPGETLYGVNCGLGGSRWFFGPSYENPFTVDDMQPVPGAVNQLADRIELTWFWNPTAGTSTCWYFCGTGETFDGTCTGPALDGDYGAWGLGFYNLAPGGNYYYYTDSDPLVMSFQMPMDGQGAFYLIIGQSFINNTIVLANITQSMLWGTKNALNTNPGTNLSYGGPMKWDDDNITDGTLTAPTECYDYGTTPCPGEIGACTCFYYPGPHGTCGDANCDGSIDGSDIAAFFAGLSNPNQWILDHPGCDIDTCLDINGDHARDGADITPFFNGPMAVGYCL